MCLHQPFNADTSKKHFKEISWNLLKNIGDFANYRYFLGFYNSNKNMFVSCFLFF